VRENIDDLHDIVCDFVCEIGADFLAANKIIQISSSYGYVGRDKLSVHVEWELEKPLTLARKKRLAEWLNEQCRKHGFNVTTDDRGNETFSPPFDLRIYSAEHFLYVTQPAFVRRTHIGNSDVLVPLSEEEAADVDYFNVQERVTISRIGEPVVQLPDDVAAHVFNVSAPKSNRRDDAEITENGFANDNLTTTQRRKGWISEISPNGAYPQVMSLTASISNEREEARRTEPEEGRLLGRPVRQNAACTW
jgi:hypothetical protein